MRLFVLCSLMVMGGCAANPGPAPVSDAAGSTAPGGSTVPGGAGGKSQQLAPQYAARLQADEDQR